MTLIEVPADGLTVGEVMVKGNIVMKGYLGNEKATRYATYNFICFFAQNIFLYVFSLQICTAYF